MIWGSQWKNRPRPPSPSDPKVDLRPTVQPDAEAHILATLRRGIEILMSELPEHGLEVADKLERARFEEAKLIGAEYKPIVCKRCHGRGYYTAKFKGRVPCTECTNGLIA